MVLASPVDVQIDKDNKTMVQPDVLVVCDRSKVIRRCIYGAPDLIVEVLSPSTRRKDMTLRLSNYALAGVREYWMVDPDRKKIVVYDLENEEIPQVYGREARVPVGIFGYLDFLDDRKQIPDAPGRRCGGPLFCCFQSSAGGKSQNLCSQHIICPYSLETGPIEPPQIMSII